MPRAPPSHGHAASLVDGESERAPASFLGARWPRSQSAFWLLFAIAADQRKKRRRGETTGGVAPFGFDFVDGRKVPRADQQETLQEIKQLRADGKSWQAVAATLTQTGRRTRTGGTFSRQGIHQTVRKAGLN